MRESPKSYKIIFDFAYIEEDQINLMIVIIKSESNKIMKLHCEMREKYSKVFSDWFIIP